MTLPSSTSCWSASPTAAAPGRTPGANPRADERGGVSRSLLHPLSDKPAAPTFNADLKFSSLEKKFRLQAAEVCAFPTWIMIISRAWKMPFSKLEKITHFPSWKIAKSFAKCVSFYDAVSSGTKRAEYSVDYLKIRPDDAVCESRRGSIILAALRRSHVAHALIPVLHRRRTAFRDCQICSPTGVREKPRHGNQARPDALAAVLCHLHAGRWARVQLADRPLSTHRMK
jgi:hypothetical protein